MLYKKQNRKIKKINKKKYINMQKIRVLYNLKYLKKNKQSIYFVLECYKLCEL